MNVMQKMVKSMISFTVILSSLLLASCGGSSDGGAGSVSGIPFLSVGNSLVVNGSNQTSFKLSGECLALDSVKVSGALLFEVDCESDAWEKTLDLSYLPNGIYKLKLEAGEEEIDFELKKDTLSTDAVAFYNFDDSGDLGKDQTGNHNAQSVQDVTSVNDAEVGLVAQFNGSSSAMTLSDGSFFNDEFKKKSFIFSFKTADTVTSQMLVDEGGSGNGIGLRIENDQLILATRAGGDSTQTEVTGSLSGLANSWVNVIASFDDGELSLSINGTETTTSASYSVVPSHGDSGGLGDEIGSSVFTGTTVNPFAGELNDFRVFNKTLSEDELVLLAGDNPEAREVDSLSFGRVVTLDFSNGANLGENGVDGSPSGNAQNVVQELDDDKGNVASFNGTDAYLQMSNGTFWNTSFSVKTYALFFKASDLLTEQVLFEEGGSTNGVSLRIENGYLFADAKAGNSAPQQTLIEDIIDLDDEWVKVVVQFDNGSFKMTVVGKGTTITRSATFTTIPDHSSDGGLGRRIGGDASGNSGDAYFTGLIHKFSTFNRPLSTVEVEAY